MATAAQDIIDAIDAAILAGLTGPGQIRSADGRMITYRSLTELKDLRQFYARQLARSSGGTVRLGDFNV